MEDIALNLTHRDFLSGTKGSQIPTIGLFKFRGGLTRSAQNKSETSADQSRAAPTQYIFGNESETHYPS